MVKRAFMYIARSLVFRKGHRFIGVVLWIIIVGVLSDLSDYVTRDAHNAYNESLDYQTMCATGEFQKAHAVKVKYYKEYSSELGAWRSGAWRDRQARKAQEKYHATAAYIFAQEIVSVYNSTDTNKSQSVINLLVAIPAEGAPLAEGEYGSGMFYNNDASITAPTAIDHMVYQSWVRFFNDCCDKVLDLALANDDMTLANRVCRIYKKEVSTHFVADTIKGGDYKIATVKYNDLRINTAKQKVMESTISNQI